LLFPGLAAAAPPAYKNRAVRFVISNQNLFCQASLGLEMGASAPPDCITRHGGFLTSQPGVIGRLPEIGRGSSCFYRPESHRRDTGCQLSATCQAQQTYFFTQSAGNIFSICDRLFRRCFAGSSYEPMTYLLLWKPRLLLFDRLGGGGRHGRLIPVHVRPKNDASNVVFLKGRGAQHAAETKTKAREGKWARTKEEKRGGARTRKKAKCFITTQLSWLISPLVSLCTCVPLTCALSQ